jgi:MarR-like DNA-binding transcriptional regulator SgrR of sgrS sRNA
VALFQLKGSSNEESEFERVRFGEKGCGCCKFNGRLGSSPSSTKQTSVTISSECLDVSPVRAKWVALPGRGNQPSHKLEPGWGNSRRKKRGRCSRKRARLAEVGCKLIASTPVKFPACSDELHSSPEM